MAGKMSRRKFIESHGATCKNWQWSWSFINERERFIVFGAWDRNTEGNTSLILSDSWKIRSTGRRPPAYGQSREHIRLIEENGYKLKTFKMVYSDNNKDENGVGPPKIAGFDPVMKDKILKRIGSNWYASDDEIGSALPEEIQNPQQFIEGASQLVSVNKYERSIEARQYCIEHHGYICAACDFDFEKVYGDIGRHYIHVHHIIPLSKIRKEYVLDAVTDMVPVCANCHAIIHRTQPSLTVSELRKHLGLARRPGLRVTRSLYNQRVSDDCFESILSLKKDEHDLNG